MNKDNICMICHAYYPLDSRIRREAECLVENGYNVDILCLRDKGESASESINKVRVFRLPVMRYQESGLILHLTEYMVFFLMSAFVLAFRWLKNRYHVIHVHNLPDFLVFTAFIPKLFGSRVILDIHDVTPELMASKYDLNMDNYLIKIAAFIEMVSTKFAHHILTPCVSFKEAMVSRGVPENKISILSNVADEKLFNINLYKSSKSEKAVDDLKLMYHGALNEQYDFETLLGAMSILRNKIKNFHLDIFGGGPMLPYIKRQISLLSLENYVYLRGWVPLDSIPMYIDSHDIGIVPMSQKSFANIALPTRLFEYVVMQLPVIASRKESIEEYFDDLCIKFYEPGNKEKLAECIYDLYLNHEKRRYLALNANRAYQSHRWNVTKTVYCDLVTELCK